MIHLVCPTLDLFVYYLQEKGGKDITHPEYSGLNLSEQFAQTLPVHLGDRSLCQPHPINHLEVTTPDKSVVEFEGKLESQNRIKGSYRQFTLDENHGLAVNISVDGKFIAEELVNCLDAMLTLIPELDNLPGKLGQTWMVSGWVENSQKDDREILADEVYKILIPEGWQYQEKGQFLGGIVFEFWRASPQRWEKMATHSHLVLILYPNQKTMGTGAAFNEDWKELFCYRHKIIWAYTQSRELKRQMMEEFNQISDSLKNLYSWEFAELKLALQNNAVVLSNFVKNINKIEGKQQQIDLNLHQYENSAQSIAKKAGQVFQVCNDFKFIQEFSAIVKAKYQKQIEQDYASLRPHLNVLENLRGTIASIVEISQAQSDRDFQIFACLVGTGIGSAALVASSSPSWMIPLKQSPAIAQTLEGLQVPEPWANFSVAVSLSAIAGLMGCLVASVCIAWFCPKRLSAKSSRFPHSRF